MTHAKNYENRLRFDKDMLKKNCRLFFLDTVYLQIFENLLDVDSN